MRATLLWAPGTLRPTLQGLNQVLFLIGHNQAMLGAGKGERKLGLGSCPSGPRGPISVVTVSILLSYWVYFTTTFPTS